MEKRQYFNEQPGIAGEMSLEFDMATGRTISRGSGFWSVRQATAFFADWRRIVVKIHGSGVSISALVDLGDGQVQSAEVVAIIAGATSEIYRPGDAIAMLAPNSLAKMQMRRALDGRYHEFFVSRNAAETWLAGRLHIRQAKAC